MIDPVSSVVAGHAAGKLLDKIGTSFRTHVVERWSRRRAQEFFEQFCREVELELSGSRSESLEDLLDQMLEDDTCSELLFDSYRRVALSRSKAIGPRIIGILTAQLAVESRDPSEFEEAMLNAAEDLSDDELVEFATFIRRHLKRANNPDFKDENIEKDGTLAIKSYGEQIDSAWNREYDISVSPLNLSQYLGTWAPRMRDLGILADDVKERTWEYREDSERHIDEDGTIREISWWFYVDAEYFRLAELVDRVSKR